MPHVPQARSLRNTEHGEKGGHGLAFTLLVLYNVLAAVNDPSFVLGQPLFLLGVDQTNIQLTIVTHDRSLLGFRMSLPF